MQQVSTSIPRYHQRAQDILSFLKIYCNLIEKRILISLIQFQIVQINRTFNRLIKYIFNVFKIYLIDFWTWVSIRSIIYKIVNVCPFEYTAIVVSWEVGTRKLV